MRVNRAGEPEDRAAVENSELGLGFDELEDDSLDTEFTENLEYEEVDRRKENISREFSLYTLMAGVFAAALILLVVDMLLPLPQRWEWLPGAVGLPICLAGVGVIVWAIRSRIRSVNIPLLLVIFGMVALFCSTPISGLVEHLRLQGLKTETVESCIENARGVIGQSRNGANWAVTTMDRADIRDHRLERESDGTWTFVGEPLPGCS